MKYGFSAAVLAVSAIAPSAVDAATFSMDNVNDALPITLTIDSTVFNTVDHNDIIITISDLAATGGLDIPSLKRDVNNQTVSLDIESVNLWSGNGDIVQMVAVNGDAASTTVSVAKLTPTYITSNLGTWNAGGPLTVSLADLKLKGAVVGNVVTLYADFNVIDSGLLSGWSWGGGLSGEINYTTIPEIASFGVLGLGSVGLMLLRRR